MKTKVYRHDQTLDCNHRISVNFHVRSKTGTGGEKRERDWREEESGEGGRKRGRKVGRLDRERKTEIVTPTDTETARHTNKASPWINDLESSF